MIISTTLQLNPKDLEDPKKNYLIPACRTDRSFESFLLRVLQSTVQGTVDFLYGFYKVQEDLLKGSAKVLNGLLKGSTRRGCQP